VAAKIQNDLHLFETCNQYIKDRFFVSTAIYRHTFETVAKMKQVPAMMIANIPIRFM
jgi:hypothetical protein